jgi:hypothetical protein
LVAEIVCHSGERARHGKGRLDSIASCRDRPWVGAEAEPTLVVPDVFCGLFAGVEWSDPVARFATMIQGVPPAPRYSET